MTWAQHWSVLLNGAAGSFVGLVGVFSAFWLTRRHERQTAAAERSQREADVRTEARTASVQRIVGAVPMQPKDLTFAPFYGNAQVLELFAACLNFHTVNGRDHPAVAAWVVQQFSRISEARRRFWWIAWIPVVRARRADAWGQQLALLGDAVSEWHFGRRDEAWFKERLVARRKVGDSDTDLRGRPKGSSANEDPAGQGP